VIKIKVIAIQSRPACLPDYEDQQLGPVEDFIAQVGYQNIKEIKVQSTSSDPGFYHIIYEDGLPYTPRTTPKKKGLFG
jgi:hypothetical protein